MPLAGGDNIEPVVLMTIPVGGGEGEITPQNGEFTTPVAVFPTSLLVIEDAPFAGFSGRGLQFDRSGQWQQDLLIDGIAGSTPLWVEAAPNGVLFVAAIIDSPDDLHVRVSAHRLDGNTFRVLKTVDLPGLDDTAFELAPDGLVTGGTRIMEIETGAVAEDVAATVGIVDAAWVRVGVVRAASTGEHRWVIDAELDLASPPNTLSTRAGRFGNGAWYSGVTSNAPGMNSTFIALLATDEASTWYRFGAWDLAATDAEQLILTSITLGGLVVGTMNA